MRCVYCTCKGGNLAERNSQLMSVCVCVSVEKLLYKTAIHTSVYFSLLEKNDTLRGFSVCLQKCVCVCVGV